MFNVASLWFIVGVLVAAVIAASIGEFIFNYHYWQRTKDLEKRVKELESHKHN